MKEARKRAWLSAVVAVTLLLPAVASSADTKEKKLDEIQAEREESQEKIEVLELKTSELRSEAKRLNDEISGLRNDVAKLDERIAVISSRVRSVQARIDATQAEIDAIKTMATSQAVALYKAGSGEALEALLDSDSLTELDNKIELMGVAAQENTNALIRYGRLRVTIQDQHRELFAVQEELEGTRADQAEKLAELDKAHEKLEINLAELQRRLDKEEAHEEILARQEQKLKQDILAAQAGSAVAAKGVSTSGYIWPLGGAITSYYGPRWGRMHTGIDIDGTTGQPIVASKGGRVILASYYGGYGNAVVIDHGGGVSTLYAHMSAFNVSNGQSVSQGQVVGSVGATGNVTGDHLHFEVRVNGSPQDPMNYLP